MKQNKTPGMMGFLYIYVGFWPDMNTNLPIHPLQKTRLIRITYASVSLIPEPTLLTGSRGLDAYPWRSNFLVWWKFNFHFLAVWWISGDN